MVGVEDMGDIEDMEGVEDMKDTGDKENIEDMDDRGASPCTPTSRRVLRWSRSILVS